MSEGRLNRFLEAVQTDVATDVRPDEVTKDESSSGRTTNVRMDERRAGPAVKARKVPASAGVSDPSHADANRSPADAVAVAGDEAPFRHVTIMTPAIHDEVEKAAKALDSRIRQGRRGRPIGMNHLIRALLDEYLSGNQALASAVEGRIRDALAKS